jgi:hypothetical protein
LAASWVPAASLAIAPAAQTDQDPPLQGTLEPSGPSPVSDAQILGEVRDARRGTPLACEEVLVLDRDLATSCDQYGRFRLEGLEPGPIELLIIAAGHRDLLSQLELRSGQRLERSFELRRGRSRTTEIVVHATPPWRPDPRSSSEPDTSTIVGTHRLVQGDHRALGGSYDDVQRSLHRAPGIVGDTLSNVRFFVRGGLPHETLVEIDGIRIGNPAHLAGSFSIFDANLLRELQVETGVPGAAEAESLSGILRAQYHDGPHDRIDGTVDLSFLQGAAALSAKLDREGKATMVAGARRSLLQGYLGLFQAAGALDVNVRTVDYGDYFLRFRGQPDDRNRLRVTGLYSHDRMLLDDVNLHHRVVGGALDWHHRAAARTEVELLAAYSWNFDAEPQVEDFEYPNAREWLRAEHRLRVRALVAQGFGERHLLRAGLDGAYVLEQARGELLDRTTTPTWAALPLADYQHPVREQDLRTAWPELAVFAEHEWRRIGELLDLRVGIRVNASSASRRPWASPRLGLSLPLPSGTVIRGAVGLLHQELREGLLPDQREGLGPERNLVALLAVAQDFGEAGVVRLSTWYKGYDRLVVHADDPAASNPTANQGTGSAVGAEIDWSAAVGRWELGAGYAIGSSQRSNPLNQRFPQRIAVAADQRHGAHAQGRVWLGRRKNLMLGLSYSVQSGWPLSTVSPLYLVDREQWLWEVDGLNDRRLPWLHRLDFRLEHRSEYRRWRLITSFEVNAEPGGRVFTENCRAPEGDDEEASCELQTFLPQVRPWLGIKAEF